MASDIDPVAARRRRPAPERREIIVAAAREVFLEGGLAAARTKDIAERAGITEAMIYRFFRSKDELFDAAVLEPLANILSEPRHVGQIHAAAGDEERLDVITAASADLLETMKTVMPMLGVALFAQEDGAEFYRDRIVPLLATWTDSTREALTGWDHGEVDPTALTLMQFGHAFMIAMDAFLRGEELDVEGAARRMAEYSYRGVIGAVDPGA